MRINDSLNVFILITCLLFFATQIRSVSSSKYSVETIDEGGFLYQQTLNVQTKNMIKNKINLNNRYKKGNQIEYRDL